MIHEVLADGRQIKLHGNVETSQIFGRSDPRKHQKLGGMNRTSAQKNLVSEIGEFAGIRLATYPKRSRILNDDFVHQVLVANHEVWSQSHRLEIPNRDVLADAAN